MRRPWTMRTGVSIAVLLLIGGCAASGDDGVEVASTTAAATALGDPFPSTDPVAFAEAADTFAEVEFIEDGLGPTFNEGACGTCHSIPVLGGSGEQVEQRFGRVTDGVFFGFDRDEEDQGGTLRQLFANGEYIAPNGQVCTVNVETEPASANIRTGRRTTPLFGLGLVDAMPDGFFDFLAAIQPASVRGTVMRVPVALPDPRDPTQTIGSMRVGRFGHKALVPSLLVFSGDAYDNEMGITTQSCFSGTSILAFAIENFPNNVVTPPGCNGGDLAPLQPPGVPDVPELTDDVVGPCDDGRTEIQDDLVLFTTFMENLAPPPQDTSDPVALVAGAFQFARAQCATCHTPIPFITPRTPFNGVPGNFVFFPFSDFLTHDMGALSDGIGNSGEPVALTRLMRTAPLWGARFNTTFLHDGRATSVRDAILAHDGQGRAARDAFNRLRNFEKNQLIKFVNSI